MYGLERLAELLRPTARSAELIRGSELIRGQRAKNIDRRFWS
jgi:hypothetical protein